MINWLSALKVLPWSDMIDYAPTVVSGAQKLWQRAKNQRADTAADDGTAAVDPAQEIEALREQVQLLNTQQLELSNLLNELAAQNQRLVNAVDVLRTRTRILFWFAAVLAVACGGTCAYLFIAH